MNKRTKRKTPNKNYAIRRSELRNAIANSEAELSDKERGIIIAAAAKKQTIGVRGGVIRPTEIDTDLFKRAIEIIANGKRRGSNKNSKFKISSLKYNSAWKRAVALIDKNELIESKINENEKERVQ